jgi:nitrilase
MIKVAAVQGAPKYLALTGTLAKMRTILEQAADHGCQLIAFPQVYTPGYPYWVWLERPCVGQKLFAVLYRNSVRIPGPAVTELSRMARRFRSVIVVGVNEVEPSYSGTIYNTNIIVDADGPLLGTHRKLVPTYAEKLVGGNGDGSGWAGFWRDRFRAGEAPRGVVPRTNAIRNASPPAAPPCGKC